MNQEQRLKDQRNKRNRVRGRQIVKGTGEREEKETKKKRRDRRDRSGREDKMEIDRDKTEEGRREIREARKKTEEEWEVLLSE